LCPLFPLSLSNAAFAMSTSSSLSPDIAAPTAGLAQHSRFFQRLQRRYAQELPLLPPGAPCHATLEPAFAALQARGYDVGTALRVLRQMVMERLIRLEC
jgi:glutamate-ammonia-ligase adenylyltransferase